tara:strand:+ start:283 stop:498 length:216 start_codon:yes stop_codon:yes gene_type:complete
MKWVMFMYFCSHIEGNVCKPIEPEITYFATYRNCAVKGYNYSADLIKNFEPQFVNEYQVYTLFTCKEMAET